MDGVQRNFSMMAEKIDRMRRLRERCDSYVRLIKLTLDETIQEQNYLLDGSAIHNKLKYLGLKNKTSPSLPSTFSIDKIYPESIDYDNKYKYLVFDGHVGVRKPPKKINLNANDLYLSNDYSSSYKPRARDFSSTVYDDPNDSYYIPVKPKKYGNAMDFPSPNNREYQVYYFPTSKPISQYPRQTTERFYRRKPLERYPEEEVPYWPTRYPKPVRVVEREPSYPMINYGYGGTSYSHIGHKTVEPYTPEYHARYFPSDENVYHNYDDSNFYYGPDLGHRSFPSVTRPCSPVYSRDTRYRTTHSGNSGSLLEKKIRDYVWRPREERIEKYTSPSYEKSSYHTDFKPSRFVQKNNITGKHLEVNSQMQSRKNEKIQEYPYKSNPVCITPERRPSNDDNFQTHKNDDDSSESSKFYKKKNETPVNVSKRISFDLGNEHNELLSRKNSIEDESVATKEHKLSLARRESMTKYNDDKRRTSLLSDDNCNVLTSKQRVSANESNGNFRRESLSKLEKLASIGNSFDSDKRINQKNNFEGNDLVGKNKQFYDSIVEKIDYNQFSGDQNYPETKDEKKVDSLKSITNGNVHRNPRRDSNDNVRRKFGETNEKSNLSYQEKTEKTPDKTNFSIKRRDSYKNEQKLKKESILANNDISKNLNDQLENVYKKHQNGVNELSKNITHSPTVDYTKDNPILNTINGNGQETSRFEQFDNNAENYSKTVQPYQVDSNQEINGNHFSEKDNSDFNTMLTEGEQPHDILNDEYTNNTGYYQDQPNDGMNENPTNQYEIQQEHVDNTVENRNHYQEKHADNSGEIATNQYAEPMKQNEFANDNNIRNEYYYQNPTDIGKEHPIDNQFENPDLRENYAENPQPNDEYYYQNHSNADSNGQPENQYAEQGHHGEYAAEHVKHDDYYYQDHPKDETKVHQEDQQYVNPNYQGTYADEQQAHDDYYYQNYPNADLKGQPENQYAEQGHHGEYAAEHVEHDDYYYQNRPKVDTLNHQGDDQYGESNPQRNYENGGQDGYYYENHSNAEGLPSAQYDEHAHQANYAGDQHANDGYYYQEHDANYNESNQQNQHNPNAPYYEEQHPDGYQQNYEDNNYQAQQSEYIESYDRHPGDENYVYTDNFNETQSTNQIPSEQST